jgi:NadR type nicotinamide-nucleotide adenylyltransferase
MTVPSSRRFRHGLVLGKFYPLHAGHQALIRAASRSCDRVTVQLLASSVESIPLDVRAEWLRSEHPEVCVVAAMDDAEVDFRSPTAWDEHMRLIESLLDEPVDAAFTSDAYGSELARRLGAAWVQVDPGRTATPVSGTAVRADLPGHWWALSAPVRAWFAKRVIVVGAESTGTTTLARDLADRFRTLWVPEFGREWSELRPGGLAAPWHTAEFDLIALEQSRREDEAARRAPAPLVIGDTDALATTIWHERYVGGNSASVERLAKARQPDLYILTGDDIPFVQDGMRDGGHLRRWMTERFREALGAGTTPWLEVRGPGAERLERAASALEGVVPDRWHLTDPLGCDGSG